VPGIFPSQSATATDLSPHPEEPRNARVSNDEADTLPVTCCSSSGLADGTHARRRLQPVQFPMAALTEAPGREAVCRLGPRLRSEKGDRRYYEKVPLEATGEAS
jgi:hypothetical protein